MTDTDDRDRYRAPALDKGLDILELLAAEEAMAQLHRETVELAGCLYQPRFKLPL